LAYISASRFHTTKHAGEQWANLKLTAYDIGAAVSDVVKWFDETGGDDKVAKSPAFQNEIKAKADEVRNAPKAED
jgi:hypothetical protein